jgi:DNA-binding SARP family transcriptional activator
MSDEAKKTSLDERLEALTQTLELAVRESEEMRARMEKLDERERTGRQAILRAMEAYLRTLNEADQPGQ